MPDLLEKKFGEILKRLRQEKDISQETLAYSSELDRTYISLLERGERQPTIQTLFKLAAALGKKPSDIIKELENVL
jgi:transcriptional regulator with XRE-family HTH domain